jgi:hypothetical protein
LELEEAGTDLEVTLQAVPDRTDPARCALSVQVGIASRGGWPHLAGTEVVLRHPAGLNPQPGTAQSDTQWTDAYGEVVFEDLAVDELDQVRLVITACAP